MKIAGREYLFCVAASKRWPSFNVQKISKSQRRSERSPKMNVAIHRFAAVSFAVMLGPLSLAAQKPAETSQVYVLPAPTTQECPVSMHAQHGSDAGLLLARQAPGARNAPKPESQAPSQQILLTLKN